MGDRSRRGDDLAHPRGSLVPVLRQGADAKAEGALAQLEPLIVAGVDPHPNAGLEVAMHPAAQLGAGVTRGDLVGATGREGRRDPPVVTGALSRAQGRP